MAGRQTFKVAQKKSSGNRGKTMANLTQKIRERKSSMLSGINDSFQTLGNGTLLEAVILPEDEELNEWLAANTVDFFNELTILYGFCARDIEEKNLGPGQGFPKNIIYYWDNSDEDDPGTSRLYKELNGPEYVELVFTWVENLIENPTVFPIEEDEDWPDDFKDGYVFKMFRRMFRVFAIIYHNHFQALERDRKAINHLNTCFKHFIFFAMHWELIDFESDDVKVLKKPIKNISAQFQKETAEHFANA